MYQRYELNNGIQIVTEKIPHFRSVSIGMWFKVGSVDENEKENGLSHFIEHMLFKGTINRTAKEIAETMDAVGGQLNAFTAKECTCFYCKVIDEHLDLALDLLSDMILNSTFDDTELQKEKGVVLEEIYMYEDSPEDLVYDLVSSTYFGSHRLGQPILGTIENLNRFTRDEVLAFFNRFYTPNNMVISVAGNFDENNLISLIEKYFGQWDKSYIERQQHSSGKSNKRFAFKKKDIEQAHLCIAGPGVQLGDDNVYPVLVFNNLFGGGMSSRLFQEIREERGLAYSVFSYPSSYLSGGLFTIYAGTKPEQITTVASLIKEEIGKIKSRGVSKEEFQKAKEQLKGNYILGLESTSSRMIAIGRSQLLLERITTPAEILNKIDKVSIDDVYGIIDEILDPDKFVVATVARDDWTEELMKIFD
mgnify:CR=1 FL=1